MTVRNWALALVGATLIAWLPGCIISVNSSRNPYELCSTGDTCLGGTSCVVASSPGSSQQFCTNSCTPSTACPADPAGNGQVCASGQCYRACSSANTCDAGFTCVNQGSGVNYCAPGTISSTCGGSGQSCCTTGTPCTGALVCGTTGSGTANICGLPATCGANGQVCCSGANPCSGGLTCSAGVCGAACGNVGQACCAGNTCTAPGAACGSNGLCGLAPYSGCSGASIGAACLGGVDASGGSVIGTTCTVPMIANPGSNGFCTAACDGSAGTGMSMCPTWVGATRSYTYNCYLLQGAASGNCFIDCPNGETCPANTICSMTPVMGGAPVRICMPMPS